jgi:cell shape-determining protein MreD
MEINELTNEIINQAANKIVLDWWISVIVLPVFALVFGAVTYILIKKAESADDEEFFFMAALISGGTSLTTGIAFVAQLCTISTILNPKAAAIHYLLNS